MELANIWLYIVDTGTPSNQIEVSALTDRDVDSRELDVVVSTYSGTSRYFNGYFLPSEAGWTALTRYNPVYGDHAKVLSIYAKIGENIFTCWRQDRSTSEFSVWACLLRE